MAVTKQQKQEILAKLTDQAKNADSIGFAQTNGLSVAESQEMRDAIREVDSTYMIAKKTLIVRAIKDALGIDIDINMLPGQVGMICSNADPISGLSKANTFVKKYKKEEKVVWVASIMDGQLQDAEQTKQIAGMPTREELLGRLVGSMKSPISALARWFDAAATELETQGKETVGQLEGSAPVTVETVEVVSEDTVKETVAESTEANSNAEKDGANDPDVQMEKAAVEKAQEQKAEAPKEDTQEETPKKETPEEAPEESKKEAEKEKEEEKPVD